MLDKPTSRPRFVIGVGCTSAFAALAFASACSKQQGPRDLGNKARAELDEGAASTRDGSAEGSDRVLASPVAMGRKPRELVRANSRAITTDAAHVYFGDSADDTLCSLEKMPAEGAKNEPVRLARRAPVAGALSLDAHDAALAWIGNPGDVVLRVPVAGGTPTTIRDRGIFTDVAASGGDVFVTEARGTSGTLTRVTGTTAAQLATFDGTPRGIAVDAATVYVATSSRLVSSPRTRGEVSELARGSAFASPQLDGGWLYATAAHPTERGRIVVRVKTTGGALETVATNVRDAAIALHRGTLFWFDADRPALMSSRVGADVRSPTTPTTPTTPRPPPRVVSEDPMLERATALTVDEDGAFLAVGHGEDARIVAVSLR